MIIKVLVVGCVLTGTVSTIAGSPEVSWDSDRQMRLLVNDGDYDLVVNGFNLHLVENIGTSTEPMFDSNIRLLPMTWGIEPLPAAQNIVDWNNDGLEDFISYTSVIMNSGGGNPWKFGESESLLPEGQSIVHPAEDADGLIASFSFVADFDNDGKQDILEGNFAGKIWFHKNLSQGSEKQFDMKGVLVTTEDGKPLRVGPDPIKERELYLGQSSRISFTIADFNNDKLLDIVTRDFHGNIQYFQRQGSANETIVALPIKLTTGIGIGQVLSTDWNKDGWNDVIIPLSSGRNMLFVNTAGKSKRVFEEEPGNIQTPLMPEPGTVRLQSFDMNQDGDEDLLLWDSWGFNVFLEKSFHKHGYAQGAILYLEKK
jgi:hypothetical protein